PATSVMSGGNVAPAPSAPSIPVAPAQPVNIVTPVESSSMTSPAPPPPAPPPSAVEGMGASSLVDSVVQENELLWQQSLKIFHDSEEKIRADIAAEDFTDANRTMDYARQTIESARRYAYPPSKYDEVRQQSDDLSRFITSEQRKYDERTAGQKREEIQKAE